MLTTNINSIWNVLFVIKWQITRCNTVQSTADIKSDAVVLIYFVSTVNMKITPQASLKENCNLIFIICHKQI